MKVQYLIEVEIPPRKSGVDGENVMIVGDIPFVPQIGMYLIVANGDDCRKVESVYWDFRNGLLQVFFEFCEHTKLKDVLRAGWVIDDGKPLKLDHAAGITGSPH